MHKQVEIRKIIYFGMFLHIYFFLQEDFLFIYFFPQSMKIYWI